MEISPVPVVPVNPTQIQETYGSITETANALGKHRQEDRAKEYHSKRTGTTGTTGTNEDFCGFPIPNKKKENGEEREHGMQETEEIRNPAPIPSVHEPATCTDIEDECINPIEPLLLRDGRRMWRFHAHEILSAQPAFELVVEVQRHRVVLVADGDTLSVVEPWPSKFPQDLLQELRQRAGAVIAALRSDHRARHHGPRSQ